VCSSAVVGAVVASTESPGTDGWSNIWLPDGGGAYRQVGAKLVTLGYSAIPIPLGGKRSVEDGWRARFENNLPSRENIEKWSNSNDGVGVVLGGPHCLKAADIDCDEVEVNAAIMTVLPPSAVIKRGQKGRTLFYRGSKVQPGRLQWKKDGVLKFELLGSGQQSVLPPSIHPDTGWPYAWIGDRALEDIDPTELTELPADIIERLDAALARATRRHAHRESEAGGQSHNHPTQCWKRSVAASQ
jgi:hypothetical protein